MHLNFFTYKAKDPAFSYTNSDATEKVLVRETHRLLVLHRHTYKWAS